MKTPVNVASEKLAGRYSGGSEYITEAGGGYRSRNIVNDLLQLRSRRILSLRPSRLAAKSTPPCPACRFTCSHLPLKSL